MPEYGTGTQRRTDRGIPLREAYQRLARQRPALPNLPWGTLCVIAAGGVLGALARYGLSAAFPHAAGAFDWVTLCINVSGCALIGVLMVAVTEAWQVHRVVRPFLGVGVLGGFTTFSTYTVDIQRALAAGAPRTALTYLAATLVGALAAVYAAVALTRVAIRSRHKDQP